MCVPRTFVGIDESGLQWMATDYGDVVHIATRRGGDTWSAPVVCSILRNDGTDEPDADVRSILGETVA